MDINTADYINSLLLRNVTLKAFSERFYHGKLYILEGKNINCVLTGSSNISSSGFKANRELNVLFILDKLTQKSREFLNIFDTLWDECVKINILDRSRFNPLEVEINDLYLGLNPLKDSYVREKLLELTDEEVIKRFSIWLNKKPSNIYSDLGVASLENYILFEYQEYNLIVFESFIPGNAYYYFFNQNINALIKLLKQASKTEVFNFSEMQKRGYHIKNSSNLEISINNLFIKKYPENNS